MTKAILKLLCIGTVCIAFLQCSNQESLTVNKLLFEECAAVDEQSMNSFLNTSYNISIPQHWEEHDEEGTTRFEGTGEDAGLNLRVSILPYKVMYFSKNPDVNYVRYHRLKFKDHTTILLTRNDLFQDEEDTVFWRNELKVMSKKHDKIFHFVFGIRAHADEEPDWCDYEQIINSVLLKE
jgi:hypothetical protein